MKPFEIHPPFLARICSVILCVTCFSLTSRAEITLRMRQLSVNNGLSQYEVSDVEQDGYGFMWIGTNDGLNRYDGITLKSYRNNPDDPSSISYNRVKSLAYFPALNHVWVGTDGGGINIYNYENESFRTVYLSEDHRTWQPENDIVDIKVCSDSMAFVATRTDIKLVKYSEDSNYLQVIQSIPLSSQSLIKSLYYIKDLLFIVYNTEIHRYQNSTDGFVFHSVLSVPQPGRINNIKIGADSRLYVATKKGLYYCENAFSSKHVKPMLLPENIWVDTKDNFNDIVFDNDNDIMTIVEGKGLFLLTGYPDDIRIEQISTNMNDFWNGNRIKSMYVDRTNTLWISSIGKGVGIIDLRQKQYGTLSLNSGDKRLSPVTRINIDEDGNFWVGTQRDGLFRRSPDGTVVNLNIPIGTVTCIETSGDDYWVCSGGKLVHGHTGNINAQERLYPDGTLTFPDMGAVYSCHTDTYGNFWLGCRRGVVRLSDDEVHTYDFNVQSTVKMEEDTVNNIVWVTSNRGGILQLNLDDEGDVVSRKEYHNTPGDLNTISSDVVWTLCPASDGTVYVGTDTGMNIIDPENGKVTRFPHSNLLGYLRVLSLTEDSSNNLWANTSQGVVCYRCMNHKETLINSSDGLLSNSMTEAASIFNGLLYVGSNEGVNFFSVDDVLDMPTAPEVMVTSFMVSGKQVASILPEDKVELKYSNNSISFGISVFSYNNPQKNGYVYRLKGYDKEWQTANASQPTVVYSNLPSGYYTFELKSLTDIDEPASTVQSILIRIRPAPWLSVWAWILYVSVFCSVVAVIIHFIIQKRKVDHKMLIEQIRNQAELEANENKLRFYANITHELRTPLTLITAPLQEISGRKDLPADIVEKVAMMRRNSDRLMELVSQFLDLRKMDNQILPLDVHHKDIAKSVNDVCARFSPAAQNKHINYVVNTMDHLYGWIDDNKLSMILSNMLSNSFKYTPSYGNITVTLIRQDDNCVMTVADSGCGISEEDLPHIFDRFYQAATSTASGTGIGLELVRRLVVIHKGKIEVESHVGSGTIFTVTIPIESTAYMDEECSQNKDDVQENSEVCSGEVMSAGEQDTILIVEDDEDMRSFVVSLFSDTSNHILQACDGREGLKIAEESLPDLIISDVMMPWMNGIEMCRKIKENFRTNHIPVLMLTAKDDEMNGLYSGAVDYIMKPFSPEKLLLKVKNLLEIRNSRRIDTSSADRVCDKIRNCKDEAQMEFLEKVYAIVNENLDDSSFDVSQLLEEVAVSRTQLHRKMTALTGAGVSTFIRNVRLDKSKEMLESGRYTITEVLYSVGFNSPSYFSKMFRERFGMSPTDFIKK